ncbi:MAG: tetratricopeptide repeat protein [Planctomycetales bacterium]
MSRRRVVSLSLVAAGALLLGLIWVVFGHSISPEQAFDNALAAIERGDVRTIKGSLRALDRQPAFKRHVALLEGLLLLRGRNPEAALSRFAVAGDDEPLREKVRLHTAEALYALGRLAESESILQELLAESPRNVTAIRQLAAIYYDLGANNAALAQLHRVIELDPGDYRPHRLMGLMYHDFEMDQQAVQSYERTLELDPPPEVREEVVRELAEALLAQHQDERALELLEEATPDATSLVLRAQALWVGGRNAEALAALEQARSLDPDLRSLLLLDADILATQRDLRGAQRQLERLLAGNQFDAEAHYRLARVLRQQGREDAYAAEMEQWEAAKRLSERRTELSVQAIDDPRNAAIRDELAEICEELGQPELAAMWRSAAAACRSAREIRSSRPQTTGAGP